MKRKLFAAVAASLVVAGAAFAQPYGPGYGPGPGYGMGPGMMGGYGGLHGLDLSAEQRTKISEIQRELFGKHWELMGKLHQQGGPMDEAFASGKFDEKAARKAYDAMSEARKQMFEASLQAHKRIDTLLTPEQRDQLRSGGRGRGPRK